eukprot:TRINITY_DN9815_c0_g1_i1.p1 TRINITY_DN9815_c0_g1~~TRINITY_DN9815_c0_g1_i1.p1  ORF type:complete len:724 (+),score=179.72 TRINITY_DN9815_c0_g1_i1:91-2262(+)
MASSSGGRKLDYSKRSLSDNDIHGLRLEKSGFDWEEVDFSCNDLTSKGLRQIIKFLLRCEYLRVLKLFKNRIDDDGAEGLAELVKQLPTLAEIHLSHNYLTAAGVEHLAVTASHLPARDVPLWLRIEFNYVNDSNKLIDKLQKQYSVCERPDERYCSNRSCKWRCKVHVPHIRKQRESSGGGESWGWKDSYSQDSYGSDWKSKADWYDEDSWHDKDKDKDKTRLVLTARENGKHGDGYKDRGDSGGRWDDWDERRQRRVDRQPQYEERDTRRDWRDASPSRHRPQEYFEHDYERDRRAPGRQYRSNGYEPRPPLRSMSPRRSDAWPADERDARSGREIARGRGEWRHRHERSPADYAIAGSGASAPSRYSSHGGRHRGDDDEMPRRRRHLSFDDGALAEPSGEMVKRRRHDRDAPGLEPRRESAQAAAASSARAAGTSSGSRRQLEAREGPVGTPSHGRGETIARRASSSNVPRAPPGAPPPGAPPPGAPPPESSRTAPRAKLAGGPRGPPPAIAAEDDGSDSYSYTFEEEEEEAVPAGMALPVQVPSLEAAKAAARPPPAKAAEASPAAAKASKAVVVALARPAAAKASKAVAVKSAAVKPGPKVAEASSAGPAASLPESQETAEAAISLSLKAQASAKNREREASAAPGVAANVDLSSDSSSDDEEPEEEAPDWDAPEPAPAAPEVTGSSASDNGPQAEVRMESLKAKLSEQLAPAPQGEG